MQSSKGSPPSSPRREKTFDAIRGRKRKLKLELAELRGATGTIPPFP
ncbi:MAG: hypothetical protein QXT81_06565 [Candidatus Bathyarchaeia archaeon]